MARFDPNHKTLGSLKDKVIVLTGGSSGIGAATVQLLLSAGATVVFGDITPPRQNSGEFVRTDASKYEDVLALFKHTLEKHGRVDHAIANAGLIEQPGWFGTGGINSIQEPPSEAVLDVNLKGVIYFAHIAVQYLSANKDASDKSLTLLSSQAGFKETPGLFVYQCTKHGVLGLLRTLRLHTPGAYGVRVNAVCPSMTTTSMAAGISQAWKASGSPINQPADVGRIIVGILRAGPNTQAIWYDDSEGWGETKARRSVGQMNWDDTSTGLNGRALFVLGGQAFDIEEGLDRTEDIWLGSKVSKKVERAQKSLGKGDNWIGLRARV